MQVKNEDQSPWEPEEKINDEHEGVIEHALSILKSRIRKLDVVSSPKNLINYLRLQSSYFKKEKFSLIYLNAKNGVIHAEVVSEGTIDQTAVYPREIVIKCLEHGATAVILAHNHPSGDPAPSEHDMKLTKALKETLKLVNVNVHDHIIIGDNGYYSFAKNRNM